ncbi:hypothetical protein AVEN_216575-1 [Araneus ventricosus]|uniref:Uncharacterized protein n=1 Tax=Araneus ventricosus TaxID=182803 RepID=A0A4Y2G4Q3_ARAVE|nr:hypothetical protein AVEN_216575-1 [Araneus ventricosus]
MTRTTLELPSPLQTTAPHQQCRLSLGALFSPQQREAKVIPYFFVVVSLKTPIMLALDFISYIHVQFGSNKKSGLDTILEFEPLSDKESYTSELEFSHGPDKTLPHTHVPVTITLTVPDGWTTYPRQNDI